MDFLVIGESCLDVFSYGTAERLCPDAPVPVFNLVKTKRNGGMAMNVKNNLASLGVDVNICTNLNWEKVVKNRFIEINSNHMFMRLDSNDNSYKRFSGIDDITFDDYDAVVISDYDKGFLIQEDIEKICSSHEYVFLDTKKPIGNWCANANFIKINNVEYKKSIEKNKISKKVKDKLITTLGKEGCLFRGVVYPVEEVEVKDVSGAGDTFLSGFCYEYMKTKNIKRSIDFANNCATTVVQRRGVSVV
jgi:bifunctional ADP-heptose synthase (sugar kinase/adenylyltransferase)